MERVDYLDTFIAVSDDCAAGEGTPPPVNPDRPSVVARTYQMIVKRPYSLTSGDVIFTVFADRHEIPMPERPAARIEFFSKGQPCLRSSDLAKRYGWGIHCDARGRVGLLGVDTPEYQDFVSGNRQSASGLPVTVTKAMRRSRITR